ncbi:hypothetical protein IRJ41_024695 [Triplophysa rosa]|uniref:Ig-like domain-containing protein n=1 Tax=Triplophysa rosa TaxID=992332 RepID=A0A9W8CD42_TRIRA|nr:hypothetical protein IRJ41_024695 [Triplophysa rosa]
MCLLLYIHTSQSEIHSQSSTEGADVFLYCKHEGKVQWTKHSDGNRLTVLTAESKEKIEKHNPDPHNRYSVIDDLSLHIKNVSVSDSGIYYCNANPTVNLTVTASDFSRKPVSSETMSPIRSGQDKERTDEPESTSRPSHSEDSTSTEESSRPTTTPTFSSYYERKATTGSIHRHSEDNTPAQDSSTRTAFTYYCMKENKKNLS